MSYTITTHIDALDMVKILIQDGEKKIETEDVKKVPEEYRPTVEKLMKSVTRG